MFYSFEESLDTFWNFLTNILFTLIHQTFFLNLHLFNYQTYVTLSMLIEWKKSSPNNRTSLIGFVRYPKKNGTLFRRCVPLITDMTNLNSGTALCFVGLKPAICLNYLLIRLWTFFYDVKRRFPHDKRPEMNYGKPEFRRAIRCDRNFLGWSE